MSKNIEHSPTSPHVDINELATRDTDILRTQVALQGSERTKKLRVEMAKQGLDVLLVADTKDIESNNLDYVLGAALDYESEEGALFVVAPSCESPFMRLPSGGGYFNGKFFDALANNILSARRIKKSGTIRVGVEMPISSELYGLIQEALKRREDGNVAFNLVDSDIIAEQRREKTPEEAALAEQGQRHVLDILTKDFPNLLYTGITESHASDILSNLITNGGEMEVSFSPIVAFGENSARPHHEPGDRGLKDGEMVLVDCGIVWHGYATDMTRNFWYGNMNTQRYDEYIKLYSMLRSAQENASMLFVHGAKVSDIERSLRDEIGRYSRYFTHSLGHGIAQSDVHAMPHVSLMSDSVLKCGDLVTNEPGIYIPGKFGIRMEDMIYILKTGEGNHIIANKEGGRELIVVDGRKKADEDLSGERARHDEGAIDKYKNALNAVYAKMEECGIDIYVAPKTEEMNSLSLERLIGFNGTFAFLVILNTRNGTRNFLLTDKRYSESVAEMCKSLNMELIEIGKERPLKRALEEVYKMCSHESRGATEDVRLGIESGTTHKVKEAICESATGLIDDRVGGHLHFDTHFVEFA